MEGLEQFFKGKDLGYARDPRRMAYAKLQKNTQGMDREQLEAFIKANLFIPHSQYKMALGNLIQFLKKQDQMNQLNEVKQFQKIAGIRAEGYMGTPYDSSEDMAVDMVKKGIQEDDYSEDPSSDMDDESQSGDTDAMDIDEAGNVKGIKIEIPGNSYASDFGKAAAREVIESFGPREYRGFLEAFLSEFKKLTGGV
jgi:glutaredoxin-related protein